MDTNNKSVEKNLISIEQIVQDIMDRWPQTIPVFLEHRMNCVGCSMASFEELKDALLIYHLPSDPFVEKLHKAIEGLSKS